MEAPGSSPWMEPIEPEMEAATLNFRAGRAGSGGGPIRAPAPCPVGTRRGRRQRRLPAPLPDPAQPFLEPGARQAEGGILGSVGRDDPVRRVPSTSADQVPVAGSSHTIRLPTRLEGFRGGRGGGGGRSAANAVPRFVPQAAQASAGLLHSCSKDKTGRIDLRCPRSGGMVTDEVTRKAVEEGARALWQEAGSPKATTVVSVSGRSGTRGYLRGGGSSKKIRPRPTQADDSCSAPSTGGADGRAVPPGAEENPLSQHVGHAAGESAPQPGATPPRW